MKKETACKILAIYSICLGAVTAVSVVGLFFLYFGLKINSNLKKNVTCKSEVKMTLILNIVSFFIALVFLLMIFSMNDHNSLLLLITPLIVFVLLFGVPIVLAIIYLISEKKQPTLIEGIGLNEKSKLILFKKMYDDGIITKGEWDARRKDVLEKK